MAEDLASTPPLLLRLCFFCVTLLLAYFTGPIFFLSLSFFLSISLSCVGGILGGS